MALTSIEACRLEVGDFDPALPILSDESYQYYLDSENNNVTRASIRAAKAILMRLAVTNNQEIVDIITINPKAAGEYRQALLLYISNPNLNPLYLTAKGWFGGVSKSEMLENNSNLDNNFVKVPAKEYCSNTPSDGFTL